MSIRPLDQHLANNTIEELGPGCLLEGSDPVAIAKEQGWTDPVAIA